MYVLDTNTLIYFFKGMGKVSDNMLSRSPQEIHIPSIIIYELHVGIAKSNMPQKREKQLSILLEQVNVIEFANAEAKAAARIRADLEAQGMPIGPIDTLIAGCAMAHDLTLVTHNTKEFSRIKGLVVEDWF